MYGRDNWRIISQYDFMHKLGGKRADSVFTEAPRSIIFVVGYFH